MIENRTPSSLSIWKKAVLHHGGTLREAVSILANHPLEVIMVVDDNDRLIGTISDLDLRRSILGGIESTSSVSIVMERNPFVISEGLPEDMVGNLMLMNEVVYAPILSKQREIVGLFSFPSSASRIERQNVVVIMAGGRGERLFPHTSNTPKPMLPIAGKPILEHTINQAKSDGFTKFILATHYLGDVIENYLGNGDKLGVEIKYLKEVTPLGTAGALGMLEPAPVNSFIVINGDVITSVSFSKIVDFHQRCGATATMAVTLHEWTNSFGVVDVQGMDITSVKEKPTMRSFVNTGIYVLDPVALSVLERNKECDMPTLFNRMIESDRKVTAFPIFESWLDVGRPDDLSLAQAKIAGKD